MKIKKRKKWAPIFRPQIVEVYLDDGEEKMRGIVRRLMIERIEYDAGYMRVWVRK